MIKRLLLFSLISLFCLGSLKFPTSVQAEPVSKQDCVDLMGRDVDQNACKTANEKLTTDMNALACALSGCVTSSEENINTGAIPTMTRTMAHLITDPPVKTSTYVADVMKNMKLLGAQPAYAQGIGFSALTPVLQVWKGFRNLAYFAYIIVFVVVGFMIMFRKQVGHNTVVTIQQALPQLIFILLLITFSYAIAGLVVDAIYLSIFVLTEALAMVGVLSFPENARNAIFGYSILRIGIRYLIGTGEVAGEASMAISQMVEGAVGFPDWITNIFAYLIVAIAIIIQLFRALIALITAYIGIIIDVIFAPIRLLAGVFPGSTAAGDWLKSLIANAAVFPAAAAFLIVGAALVGQDQPASDADSLGIAQGDNGFSAGGQGFVPPMISTSIGYFGDTDDVEMGADVVRAIIGFGMIMLLPEVLKLTKTAFGVKDAGLGEMALKNAQSGFSPVKGAVMRPFNTYKQIATEEAERRYEWKLHRPTEQYPVQDAGDKRVEFLRRLVGLPPLKGH